MTALREAGRGKADGTPEAICLTEIVVSTDALEQDIVEIYDPASSLKISMSMTPKDNALARLDNLMDIYLDNVYQHSLIEINTYNQAFDFWNTDPAEAIAFFNEQYMGNLTLADLGQQPDD